MKVLVVYLASFCIGGFPWCWLAVWLFGPRDEHGRRLDLRLIGTGNVGASNAMEFLGIVWYIPLILIDASKSYGSIWLAKSMHCSDSLVMVAAFMAVLGHCFPVWLSFKRGKGVSTMLGVLAAFGLLPELGVGLAVFLLGAALSKRPSVGILIATQVVSAIAVFLHRTEVLLLVLIAGLIWIRFADNIKRLLNGTEAPYDMHRPRGRDAPH